MLTFLDALANPDLSFLRYAFAAGMLASVAFGLIGTYVVVRRITYLAGAISHCVLGGIGAALYCRHHFDLPWLHPLIGAVAAAIAAALIIGLITEYAHQREDTVIGALWATGMALGLLFISQTPGYIKPMTYLFGNILMLSKQDVWLIGTLDAVIVISGTIFYHKFLAVCFDEEFIRLRGVRVRFYYLFLLCLTALTIVLLVTIVGIIMVVALLTLPPAIAGHFSQKLWQMMLIATVLCLLFMGGGLAVSYSANLPSSPVIILFASGLYIVTISTDSFVRRLFRRS